MRIAMLADAYKPYVSGVTNVIDLSKRYLETEGHEVFVITFGDDSYEDFNGYPLPGRSFLMTLKYRY